MFPSKDVSGYATWFDDFWLMASGNSYTCCDAQTGNQKGDRSAQGIKMKGAYG
jgi:hypothetical protein